LLKHDKVDVNTSRQQQWNCNHEGDQEIATWQLLSNCSNTYKLDVNHQKFLRDVACTLASKNGNTDIMVGML
jgi:hypothetical protein